MSNLDSLPKSVPDPIVEFSIDVEGNVSKHKYSGNFKFKVPNLRARAMAEKEKTRLNEGLGKSIECPDCKKVIGNTLDETVLDFHAMYSYLRYSLVEYPEWWKNSNYGYELYDSNVLTELYLKAVKTEADWLKEIWGDVSEPEPQK